MEGLGERNEELKARWYRYDIPKMVDAVLFYLTEGVQKSVADLLKDLSPNLRTMLSRPERETIRGFLREYFQRYTPRILKGFKRVFGRML